MNKHNDKFPKSNLLFAILSFVAIFAFFVFFFTANRESKYFLAVTAVSVLLMPIFIGSAIGNTKHFLNYFKYKKVEQFGTDGVCHIVDFQKMKYNNKKWDVRYSLVVKYYDYGIEKTYKTGYDYVAEEYKYLKSLPELKCKYIDKLLIITEKIPDNIYENLTVIGKVKSKFLRTFIVVWQIIGWIGAALVLAGIFATLVTQNSMYLIAGVLCLFIPNLICGIIYAIHFVITKE